MDPNISGSLPLPLDDLELSPPAGPPPPGFAGGRPKGPPPLIGDALVDKQVYDMIEIIINYGLINALAIFGSVGNALTIYILSCHGLSTSTTNIVLVSLAVADFLLLVTLPLRKISLLVSFFDKALAETVEAYVVSYNYLTLFRVWSLISHTHVVIIAVERFLAVYFPFKVGIWVTPLKMKVVVIATHMIWYIIVSPLYGMFTLEWGFDTRYNQTVAFLGISDFFVEHEYIITTYSSFGINLLTAMIQLTMVLTCCIAVGCRVVDMSKRRQKMVKSRFPVGATRSESSNSSGLARMTTGTSFDSGSHVSEDKPESKQDGETKTEKGDVSVMSVILIPVNQQSIGKAGLQQASNMAASARVDLRVVRMLIIVCVVYLVFVFPTFFLFLFQYVFEELRTPRWHRVNFLATSVQMLLTAVNSSVNFIIYVATSQRFYRSFQKMFSCGRESK